MESDTIVCSRYRVQEKIGAGTFGQVYKATDLETLKAVALKVELSSMRRPLLFGEARILKALQKGIGFPQYFWLGAEADRNILALQLLGPSLEVLLRRFDRCLSLPTVIQIADQLLDRVEFMHDNDYLHRDIKSDNFCIGIGRYSKIIYAVDFGLSKKFRDSKTAQHMPYREAQNLTGTSRFASLNSHLGLELSRRDDLESLAYLLIYLAQGRLPWQSVKGRIKAEKHRRVLEIKTKIKPEQLCEGLPDAFLKFLIYSRNLRFEQTPNYGYCKELFYSLASNKLYSFNGDFEWCEPARRSRSLKPKIQPTRTPRAKSHTTIQKAAKKTEPSEGATEEGCYPSAINRAKFEYKRIVKFNLTPEILRIEPTKCSLM